MPLVHLSDMLNHSYRHKYAVGAFGIDSIPYLEGVMLASENCRAPVVLNLIQSFFENQDFDLLMPSVIEAARRTTVPVAINFDHGTSIAAAERAIRAGCNGVMVDTSALPFSDNVWQTRDLVSKAHACGVTVEGELGYVPGIDGEEAKNHPGELTYTTAAEAAGFVERTCVDCLAISIGTVHGKMKGVPKLDFARLAKIKDAVDIPLVIHGGTGLSDDQFRRLIANGIAKINYYTGLADLANRRIRENVAAERKTGPIKLLSGVRDVVREEVERCIHLWGSSGRAAEVLAQCCPWQEAAHIILFNVPASLSENDVASFMREGKELVERVSGLRSIHTSSSPQLSGQYQYCLQFNFSTQAALEAYHNSQECLHFSNKFYSSAIVNHEMFDLRVN